MVSVIYSDFIKTAQQLPDIQLFYTSTLFREKGLDPLSGSKPITT